MAFWKEFKTFALKGNVMDMAVGVIIGGAFSKIVTSLVNDIIMPPIGFLLGNTDFSKLQINLAKINNIIPGTDSQAEPVYWNYGAFIQQCVDFAILAFCVFLMVRLMNKIMRKKAAAPAPAPAPPTPSKEELLLTEIRDLLKQQQGK